jgi:hypothetical protein
MLRIRLVVTGDLEGAAMVASLRRMFGGRTSTNDEVQWLRPRMTAGATTHRLRPDAPPSRPMQALARAMVAEALDGADGTPADLVIVIDDLELHNVDQPELVCAHFRAAVELVLAARQLSLVAERRARGRLRERCAFHLLSPMVESYLFGDSAALQRAGCPLGVAPQLRSADYEDFWSTDPSWAPHIRAVHARQHAPPPSAPWWQEERHAKHYLEHLVSGGGRLYEETQSGADAFAALDWPKLPTNPTHLPLLRALFDDLGDFFGVVTPLPPGGPSPHTYPPRTVSREKLLLRNL